MIFPLVTIIIPAHGRPEFLAQNLDSLIAQDYAGPVEIIVVDDESPQELKELLQPRFPQVTFVRQKQAGSSSARQTGTEIAKGAYVAYNDDDDIWEPNKLSLQIGLMEAHPEIDISITDFMKFSAVEQYTHSNFKDHNELWS